jgi:hypothetical protein
MNGTMWNIVLLTVRFFDVAKFTTLTPLSLLVSCNLKHHIVLVATRPANGVCREFEPCGYVYVVTDILHEVESPRHVIFHQILFVSIPVDGGGGGSSLSHSVDPAVVEGHPSSYPIDIRGSVLEVTVV